MCHCVSMHIYKERERVLGFPGGSGSKESVCGAKDLGLSLGSGRSPRERNGLLTPVFLPGEFHGWRSLVGSMGSQRVRHN